MHEITSLTRQELAELAPRAVAVLPIGALEQHGDHLPLGTDAILATEVAHRGLQDRSDVVLSPTLPFGFSAHHQFACAMSLRAETLLHVLGDLIDSLVKAGFRRVLILNGHGGNREMMQQAVKLATLTHPIVAGWCNYWELPDPASSPGHAGRFETDLMVAVAPGLVRPGGTGPSELPLFDQVPAPGLHLERHGEWPRTGGVTDPPGDGVPAAGEAVLSAATTGLGRAVDALLATALPPLTHDSTDGHDLAPKEGPSS